MQVVIVCAVPQLASCHPEPVYLFIFASQPFCVISFTNIIPLAPLSLSHTRVLLPVVAVSLYLNPATTITLPATSQRHFAAKDF